MAKFLGLDEPFAGRHVHSETIVLCVRRYLRFKFSFRDPAEMMARLIDGPHHDYAFRTGWCEALDDPAIRRPRPNQDINVVSKILERAQVQIFRNVDLRIEQ